MTDSWNSTSEITTPYVKSQVQMFASESAVRPILYFKLNNFDVEVTNEWIEEINVNRESGHKHKLYKARADINENYRLNDARIPELDGTNECVSEFQNGVCGTLVYYDLSDMNELDALFSLIKTIVIVIMLSVNVVVFSRGAETLVIEPIERMIRLVTKLAENPLASLYKEENANEEQVSPLWNDWNDRRAASADAPFVHTCVWRVAYTFFPLDRTRRRCSRTRWARFPPSSRSGSVSPGRRSSRPT